MSKTNAKPLENRVAKSGLITINLEEWYPSEAIISFDLKDYLFQGLILREKDYREAIDTLDASVYSDAIVHIHCSADAIVPTWAYMLAASALQEVAQKIYFGNLTEMLQQYYRSVIYDLDITTYADRRVVLKGCSDRPVPPSAYLDLTYRLRPVARSIMYGEPCSTVPIYKQKPKSRVVKN